MRHLLRRSVLLSTLAAPAIGPTVARAQSDYPNRNIRLVIPWPPGASADAFLRMMADQTGKRLGQTMVPDNKPGANGSLSAVALKDAKPDGYTLGQIHTGTFRAALMAEKPAYDPLNDFSFIIQLSGSVHGIVVRADSPWKTFEELVAAAKAAPEKLTYGTFGPASVQNLVMVDLQQRLGIKLTHVPYKGGSELYNGLLGSQIDVIADASGWIPLVQSGKFRLLVVWGSQRLKLFPDVRTLKEAGIDLEVNSPYGVCGPKGMDPAIVKRLHDAFKKAYDEPRIAELYEKYDFTRRYMNTEDYAAFVPKLAANEKATLEKLGLAKKD
jgi:tripartite-type tricarboxylate transporter receptor subunit TctC